MDTEEGIILITEEDMDMEDIIHIMEDTTEEVMGDGEEDMVVGVEDGIDKMNTFIKEFSGAAMTISFMLCYVPQILKIIKHESAGDVSPTMIFLGISGYVFGLIYMMCTGFGIWWFLNYITGLITSAVLLYYWYKHK